MTINEFIQECRSHNLGFLPQEGGLLRNTKQQCPICALIEAKTGKAFANVGAWWYGVVELGLSHNDVARLIRAADNSVSHDAEVRAKLLSLR